METELRNTHSRIQRKWKFPHIVEFKCESALESWIDKFQADRITADTRKQMVRAMIIVAAIGVLAIGALLYFLGDPSNITG